MAKRPDTRETDDSNGDNVAVELAKIVKQLRQIRERAEKANFPMLAYILRMAEAEAADQASAAIYEDSSPD